MSAQGTPATVSRDLALLAPRFRDGVEAAIRECHAQGLDAWVYEGYRSNALQELYYSRGRTVIPPKGKVTNARSNLFSWHGYGLAVDVVSKKHLWKPPEGDAWFRKVAEIFKRHDCKWGGDWAMVDLPHFQWRRCKPSPSDRARMIISSQGIPAVWHEVGASYDGPVPAQPEATAAATVPTGNMPSPSLAASPATPPAAARSAVEELGRGAKGAAVVELQMRLAGFRGTVSDGDFGPGTELQVMAFQREWMQMTVPHGRADAQTQAAIRAFGESYPIDFGQLRCPCGSCGGFGRGQFRGRFRKDIRAEAYNRYEYPGIHRMLLWTYRAAQHYAKGRGWRLTVNSCYRCSEHNRMKGRSSTNHHGKAIDIDIIGGGGTDRQRCDILRGILVEKATAQIGWSAANRKALEPASIAPTWVHLDVRCYAPQYLDDAYFVKDATALDRAPG